jgi:hypothetical protein
MWLGERLIPDEWRIADHHIERKLVAFLQPPEEVALDDNIGGTLLEAVLQPIDRMPGFGRADFDALELSADR